MKSDASVSQMGLDIHRKFSTVTARDGRGKIVWRQRLEHGDRGRIREELARLAGLGGAGLRARRRCSRARSARAG